MELLQLKTHAHWPGVAPGAPAVAGCTRWVLVLQKLSATVTAGADFVVDFKFTSIPSGSWYIHASLFAYTMRLYDGEFDWTSAIPRADPRTGFYRRLVRNSCSDGHVAQSARSMIKRAMKLPFGRLPV